jgi:hypothetical protein
LKGACVVITIFFPSFGPILGDEVLFLQHCLWKRSAFGGSMRHVELVDFHRKGIAVTKQSGDLSQEKSGAWKEYPVKHGIDGYSTYLQ